MKNIMEYKGYYATIKYEDETSTFYGNIEDIEDLVTFEGNTVAELKKGFREMVNEYLRTCKEHSKEPNKPYKGNFNVRIEPELHKKAVVFARLNNISLNQFVENAIREKVNNYNN